MVRKKPLRVWLCEGVILGAVAATGDNEEKAKGN